MDVTLWPGCVPRAARALGALMVPVECPGCGVWDLVCCPDCRAAVAGAPVRCEGRAPRLDRLDEAGPLPVWAAAAYVGAVRSIVLAWKERGRADLDPILAGTMGTLGSGLADVLAQASSGSRVGVVPAPSTRSAVRRRGRDVVVGLAGGVVAGLRAEGCAADLAPVLVQRGRGEQVGRGLRGRGARIGRVGVRRRTVIEGLTCLVVDDVVTTGATLAACEDALFSAGAQVVAGVVLAATPAPGSTASAPATHRGFRMLSGPGGI